MFLEWRINHDRGLLFTGYPTNSNDRDSMHNTCLLMFSAHNTFLYFLDRDSIKEPGHMEKICILCPGLSVSRDIWRKICILCPVFSVSWDICTKNAYYVPFRCHNRTFQVLFRPYVLFVLREGVFCFFFLYMSHLVPLADFPRNKVMFHKRGRCISVVFSN